MTCLLARQKLAGYVDNQLPAGDSTALRQHLLACGGCYEEYEYRARLSSPLRVLPWRAPPLQLAAAIRARLAAGARPGFWQGWQVHLANLMRPVALPAAGGLLTALILFGVLMPAVSMTRAEIPDDVPTALSTAPKFKQASLLPVYDDLLIEAWIDEQGKITRYEILNATQGGAQIEKELLNQSSSLLLTTMFEPATRFGQPISGKVLLSLRRINVRG